MTWRDELTQTTFTSNGQSQQLVGGSFRGVPFRTVNAELKVGRRNQVNEYPQRDVPYVDDLGRRARRIVVEAYVLGDNYLQQRDALVKAFEAAGPGELLHPRYGALQVALDGEVSIKETPEQGGIARISATFVEHGANTFPAATQDTVAEVEGSCNAADEAIEEDFASTFSVEGASVLTSQAVDGFNGFGGLRNAAADLLDLAAQVANTDGLGTITSLVGSLQSELTELVRTPSALVQNLRTIYAQITDSLAQPLAALSNLQAAYTARARPLAVSVFPGSTAARAFTNDVARSDLNRRLALTNQARALTVALQSAAPNTGSALVATGAQAIALRNALVLQIDTELEATDPPAFVATTLSRLRAAVVRDVAARAQFLKQTASYTPQAVLPALVLAHRIYQDASRADELAERNSVPHPQFMPARPLETLL